MQTHDFSFKNVYIDKIDNIVNKYNNISHRKIKIKPADVKPRIYIDFNKAINDKDPKFKTGDIVKISNLKVVLQKTIFKIGLAKFLLLEKLKKTVPWTYGISNLKDEEIVG